MGQAMLRKANIPFRANAHEGPFALHTVDVDAAIAFVFLDTGDFVQDGDVVSLRLQKQAEMRLLERAGWKFIRLPFYEWRKKTNQGRIDWLITEREKAFSE